MRKIIKEKHECCDCATPLYPCRCARCTNRGKVLICDHCGEEFEKLYQTEDGELCEECVLERLEVVRL